MNNLISLDKHIFILTLVSLVPALAGAGALLRLGGGHAPAGAAGAHPYPTEISTYR